MQPKRPSVPGDNPCYSTPAQHSRRWKWARAGNVAGATCPNHAPIRDATGFGKIVEGAGINSRRIFYPFAAIAERRYGEAHGCNISIRRGLSMLPQSNEHPVLGVGVIRKVLRLLEPLNRSEGGASIYHYIEQTLSAVETQSHAADETYAGLLTLLLSTVARQLPIDSPLQVQIRLLEVRLTPPFTQNDLAEVRSFIETHLAEIGHAGEDNAAIEGAIAPLLESFDIREGEKRPDAEASRARPAEATRPVPAAEPEYMKPAVPERRVDVSYRRHLDEKRQGIQRIQQPLSQQVSTCIKNSKSFSALLEQNLQVLQNTGAQEDIMTMRSQLIGAVENLITEQAKVAQKLEEAKAFLGEIESDSQQLSDELTRIHLLSLTDDLTSLPNRRAFLRRLQDEVSRVQRYGNPLSLALIDLDGFKSVNDKLGHAAGAGAGRAAAAGGARGGGPGPAGGARGARGAGGGGGRGEAAGGTGGAPS